jgi:hypothetical protein
MIGSQNPVTTARRPQPVSLWGALSWIVARFACSIFSTVRGTMPAKAVPRRLFAAWLKIAVLTFALAANAQSAGECAGFLVGANVATTSVDNVFCDADSGSGRPIHHDRNHAQCCVLCDAAEYDFIAHETQADFDQTYGLKSGRRSFANFPADFGPDPRALSGWASSWSSRAPPAAS